MSVHEMGREIFRPPAGSLVGTSGRDVLSAGKGNAEDLHADNLIALSLPSGWASLETEMTRPTL